MSKIDLTFKHLCETVLKQGVVYENKNRGVERLQIPSYTLRHEFSEGFPAISLKTIYWKAVVAELIWFLRGDNDVAWLNKNGVEIWNKDAYNWYLKAANMRGVRKEDLLSFEDFSGKGTGSVGQNYSKQWRSFNGKTDQIKELIAGMKKDIMSSRLKVNAWNPSELDETALPPCHSEFQIIGVPLNFEQRTRIYLERVGNIPTGPSFSDFDEAFREMGIPNFGFELHWNQRSVDVLLGLPFNIASYGLLAKLLEAITGFKALAIEGTLKCVHFYDNQYAAAQNLVQVSAFKYPNCELSSIQVDPALFETMQLDPFLADLQVHEFKLQGYHSEPSEKVEMLAPKEI